MKITQISRDPFARTSTYREKVGKGECLFCGRDGEVFRYGEEKDGIRTRIEWAKGNFCSKECFDSCHF